MDNGIDSACITYYGLDDVVNKVASSPTSSGCDDGSSSSSNGGGLLYGIIVDSNNNAGSGNKKWNRIMIMYLAHGSLMMIGWGLLLPSGAIIAKFFKHRPNGLWFKLHRSIQIVGLSLALIGWIIALTQFNVFGDKGFNNYRHGIMGMIVMVLGLLQPLNAFFRPHPPSTDQNGESVAAPTTARIMWEYFHKGSGWLAVVLAIPTIALGTMSLPNLEEGRTFQIAYGVGCGGSLLLLIAYIFYDKKTFVNDGAVIEKQKDEEKA